VLARESEVGWACVDAFMRRPVRRQGEGDRCLLPCHEFLFPVVCLCLFFPLMTRKTPRVTETASERVCV
jgi:hypothetical protein